MDFIPLSALRIAGERQCVRVRASRVCHYRGGSEHDEVKEIRMVLIDEKGDSIYAVVPAALVGQHIHGMHETAVYEVKHFQVSSRGAAMNPVENPLFITFTQLTVVRLVLKPNAKFPHWTYKLIPFEAFPTHDEPKDVIGFIRAISNIATLNIPGKNILGTRRHVILTDSSDKEMRITLWGEAALRFKGQVIRFLGREESAVAIFVGLTVHTYDGSKELAGAAQCRWYINEDIHDINILRASAHLSFQPIAQLPVPREMNLSPPAYDRYSTRPISTLLNPEIFQNQGATFLCAVTVWRLTPGQRWWFVSCGQCGHVAMPDDSSPAQPETYTCSQDGCLCTDAALEYWLHLLGLDGTGEAEFTLSGRIAQDIIGVSPQRTILNNYRGDVPVTNLAIAAIQISHTPPELGAIMSCKYKFLIHVTANSFAWRWPSFNVGGIAAYY
ncbi:unnamed protein product [Alopecurus aequalis]